MNLYEDLSRPCKIGDIPLCTGDIVSINARGIEEEIIAAFLGYLPDTDQYLFLLPAVIVAKHRHAGTFFKKDLFSLSLRVTADRAVPLECGREGSVFRNQRVAINETAQEGRVIAAVWGTIALELENGEIATGLNTEELTVLPPIAV